MSFAADDIGPLYDIGIGVRQNATGPARTLACKNREGKTVNLQSIAFMCDPSQQQEESTDLQRKQNLTQYASSNLIDRDFTNYPQATQGVWSGGEGQRVFTDPSKYWQGEGFLYPLVENAPSKPDNWHSLANAFTAQVDQSMASGFLAQGVDSPCIAAGLGATLKIYRNGATISGNVPAGQITGLAFIAGQLYVATTGPSIYYTTVAGNVASFTSAIVIANRQRLLAGGYLGDTPHLAAHLPVTGQIQLFSITNPLNLATSILITLPVSTLLVSMVFRGSELIYSVTDGNNSTIYSYDVVAAKTSVLAQLPGYGIVQVGQAAGRLFLVAAGVKLVATFGDSVTSVDLFILDTSLSLVQTLSPIIDFTFGGGIAYRPPLSISNVANLGEYVVFYVGFGSIGNTGAVYAYDVVRGALFRVSSVFTGTDREAISLPLGYMIAPQIVTLAGFTATSPMGIDSPWTIAIYASGNEAAGQAAVEAVSILESNAMSQNGTILSSIIDFTNASNKLFRQIVVDHTAIAVPSVGEVSLSVWIDQEPDSLSAAPDYQITNTVTGSTQTKLRINRVARKIVYCFQYVNARPIAIKVQASTGWIHKMRLALTDEAVTNNQSGETCFKRQANNIDAVAAYNFLRQLWRQEGGECVVTLPNGDAFDAAFESETFLSPKPFGVSFIGSRPDTISSFAEVLVREDI